MTTQQDGGPVYPTNESNYENAGGYCGPGLTLRDHYAGLAMPMHGAAISGAPLTSWHDEVARLSYETADAMLRARGE